MMNFNRLPDTAYTSMCTSSNRRLNSSFKNSVCTDCKIVIRDLDRLLQDKSGLESIAAALRFLCSFLPSYSTLCREIVNDIGDIAAGLEPYLRDPEKACERMKMCPQPGGNSSMPALLTLFQNVYMMDARVGRNNTICDDCQQACHDIVAQLQDPAQQENIKETFEALCDFVGPFKHKCIELIDQFVPQLIQWIISRFNDPLGLCTQLGFCR